MSNVDDWNDEPLSLGPQEAEALAHLERSDVFAALGEPQAGDEALVSSMVSRAVAGTGAMGTTIGTTAAKPWIIGVVGLVAAGGIVWALSSPEPAPAGRLPSSNPVVATEEADSTLPSQAERIAPEDRREVTEPDETSLTSSAATPEPGAGDTEGPEPAVSPRPRSKKPRAVERPPTIEPDVSAAELLRQANAARRGGKYEDALALYQRIGKQFPGSREDLIARVSIGKLELEKLEHPEKALAAFDAYLRDRSRGNLAEEAALGRAEALRALGRTAEERRAWEDFSTRFPSSIHRARADARLAELGG